MEEREKKELLDKILRSSEDNEPPYTDDLRKRIYAEDISGNCWGGKSATEVGDAYFSKMTPEEQDHWGKSSSFYDAILPYLKRNKEPSPFVWDLRRGQYAACIGHINGGANDFNGTEGCIGKSFDGSPEHASVSPDFDDVTMCPSAMIAYHFYHNALHDPKAKKEDLYRPSSFQHFVNKTNDLLYMYKKLRDEKGISEKAVEAVQKKIDENPKEEHFQIKDVFKQMDDLLKIPENERFAAPKEPAKEEKKPNILGRLKKGVAKTARNLLVHSKRDGR